MECYCSLRNAQDLPGGWENSLAKGDFRGPFRGPVIRFGAMVECYPISLRTSQGSTNLARKCYHHGYELIEGSIGKGDFLVADLEELAKMDATEIHSRRISAKEVLTPKRRDEFVFPLADGTAKLSRLVWSEDLRGKLQGESDDFQPTETNSKIISEPPGIGKPLRGAESSVEQDGVEALVEFWSIQGDFIYRHHIVFYYS